MTRLWHGLRRDRAGLSGLIVLGVFAMLAVAAPLLAGRGELRADAGPDLYVALDVASDTPFGGEAEPLMVVYAKGPARPLSDVSFLLARLAGQVMSRVRLIVAPELRDEITRMLGT